SDQKTNGTARTAPAVAGPERRRSHLPALRLIGPGRAGSSLAAALHAAGWRVEPPRGRGDDLGDAAAGVDLLVIATPDDVVAEVAAAVDPVPTTVVAHLAGSLGLDVLAPHRRRAALHPLVPLPDPETGAARLAAGTWFAVAGDPLAEQAVADLGGRTVTAADDQRPAYHAAELLTRAADIRAALEGARAAGLTAGLVPTMGSLHEGHMSLVRRAAAECDVVAVTVFVNPLQFGSAEDLATYPRDLERDLDLAASAGADLVFAPPLGEMYPEPPSIGFTVGPLGEVLEGASRPGHFAGVATVVAKLFNLFGAGRAYFGEKDWQQLLVVRRLVADLSFPVEVVGCPTVRDPDGVACSSRNLRLSPDERAAAGVLHRALAGAVAAMEDGERDAARLGRAMADTVTAEPLADLDYATVVRAADLVPLDPLEGSVRALVAARVGGTRLLDNVGVTLPAVAPRTVAAAVETWA
ncbi:MAG TPA: pantoate--beta-alanine ligase, partial [Acidimicrobiales bacterium]|nr:pantoate--beta-alanine ligase [Acidimicrobiales bacterium]